MIPSTFPHKNLEPDISLDYDESDTDFIETHNPDYDIDTSFVEDEDVEIRSLLRSQP